MPRILIVEDEPLIAMMVEDWLRESGHEIVGPAATVASALELLSANPVDAAILDVSLGDEDCYAIATALSLNNVPFVFATGIGAAAIRSDFAGTMVLGKPFDFNAVTLVLQNLVRSA